jgi:hypothetical protein
MRRSVLVTAASAVLVALVGTSPAHAQIGRLRRAAEQAAGAVDPSRLIQSPPPITTSLPDAVWAVDTLDAMDPAPAQFQPLSALRRTPAGGYTLRAGLYAQQNQSYCLKAGTHGPGGGDGYIYAPTRGPAEDHVLSILRNSVRNPDIPQRQVQLLLWAIIARAKFEDLQHGLQPVAAQLLTPQQLLTLNRSAWDLAGPALERAMSGLPASAQAVLRAESELRGMLASATATFDDMERVAVLAGIAPRGEGSRDIPMGRWSRHPDGYFVRYLPSGYSSTRMEVWVPDGSPAVGRELDPATHIAVPGNTARQRLVQSARVRGDAH